LCCLTRGIEQGDGSEGASCPFRVGGWSRFCATVRNRGFRKANKVSA